MLAYYDSFAGLVPCRIIQSGNWADGSSSVEVRFTATRGPYREGETEILPLRRVVPRSAVYRTRGRHSAKIMPYSWADIVKAETRD